ncbi:MAG: Hypoxanthine phosphoribosyltransferase [Chlamydiia bacterium]|nr:Hypoxanthine phosphoribosyltransferase [Chlamydiia bacterium]
MLQAQIKKGSDISPFPYPLEMLVSKDKIDERIKEAARELENDYQGKEVIFLCVMKGALFFTSDLLKEVNLPATLEYVRASSYGENGTVSGKLTLKGIENVNITDKHVIVLDDICDTGKTMTKVMAELKKLHPASLKSMVLLSKNVRSKQDYHPDYALFDIQNRFVVGYGLDYKEYYRNLDAIYILGYSD